MCQGSGELSYRGNRNTVNLWLTTIHFTRLQHSFVGYDVQLTSVQLPDCARLLVSETVEHRGVQAVLVILTSRASSVRCARRIQHDRMKRDRQKVMRNPTSKCCYSVTGRRKRKTKRVSCISVLVSNRSQILVFSDSALFKLSSEEGEDGALQTKEKLREYTVEKDGVSVGGATA